MGSHDEETERYLKEFRPQAIRELEVALQPRTILWKRLAAAGAVTACAGGLLWFGRRESAHLRKTANIQPPSVSVASQRHPRSTLALTMLALDDSKKFEAVMAEESRTSLPDFHEENSALKVLAKD